MAFDLWQLSHCHGNPGPECDTAKWKRPEVGWSKINTDAAFTEESKQGATSAVVRDEHGAFQAHKLSGMIMDLMPVPWKHWLAGTV